MHLHTLDPLIAPCTPSPTLTSPTACISMNPQRKTTMPTWHPAVLEADGRQDLQKELPLESFAPA